MVNIFVGNLSPDTGEQQVRELFTGHGAVESVTIVMDRDTGQSRGMAFVQMPHSPEALAAVSSLNGKVVNGRPLRVNEARVKADESANQMSSRSRDHRRHRI
jgi:RNA recognition motif-containing protein